jgi:hypothetical protein
MPKTVTVSAKLTPEQFTILQVLAASDNLPLSTFIRDTLVDAIDLDAEFERMTHRSMTPSCFRAPTPIFAVPGSDSPMQCNTIRSAPTTVRMV